MLCYVRQGGGAASKLLSVTRWQFCEKVDRRHADNLNEENHWFKVSRYPMHLFQHCECTSWSFYIISFALDAFSAVSYHNTVSRDTGLCQKTHYTVALLTANATGLIRSSKKRLRLMRTMISQCAAHCISMRRTLFSHQNLVSEKFSLIQGSVRKKICRK